MTPREADPPIPTPTAEPAQPPVALPFAPGAIPTRIWVRLALAVGVALFLALVLDHVLWQIAYPLALIFGAAVIAQGLAPAATLLSRWLPWPLAVVALYLGLVALTAVGIWFFVPALLAQSQQVATDLLSVQTGIRAQLNTWSPLAVQDVMNAVEGRLQEFSGLLFELPMMLFSAGTNLMLVYFLSLYWLIAQPSLRGWTLSLVPDERRDDARAVLTEVGETVGGYVRGVIMSAIVIATLTYVGLTIMGLPATFVLAVLAGLGELIPVLGPFLAAIPAVAVALSTGDQNILVVLAFYVGLQQVESNVLLPLIMRGQARIPPLLSLVAFFVGVAIGGVVGALVAIPLFGALRVVIVRVLAPAERRLVGVSKHEAAAVSRAESNREPRSPVDTE